MLEALQTLGNWLRAIPGPTEHWAAIISALAWPVAVLIIAYWLRRPLLQATHKLAARFEKDNIKIGSLLEITANTTLIPLNEKAAAEESDSFEPEDIKTIEAIFEFVGDSDENAGRLMDWIASKVGQDLDPLDFMNDPAFAPERRMAYIELVEGQKNG